MEQIRNDCAYHNANVKVVCIGGGFVYGSLGMSHQATEDLAILRALPDVVVMAPADLVEAEECTKALATYPGTAYLRLGRGGEKRIHDYIENFEIGKTEDLAILRALPDVVVMAPADLVEAEECTKALATYRGTAYLRLGRGGEKRIHDHIENFEIGKAIKVRDGKKVAIFSTGAIFEEVNAAYQDLITKGYDPAVYTFPTVKPIDAEIIKECAKKFDIVVTCEEHNIVGGFGSAVAEVIAEMKEKKAYLLRIGLNDEYSIKVGNQSYLRQQYGMDSASIVKKIEETCYL